MWMGEQQQLKRLDKKRNFSIILKKAKKFFTSLPQTVDKVLRETSVSRSIFLCVYEIYSENRKFSLGLCYP